MKHTFFVILAALLAVWGVSPAAAQPEEAVYITTQDIMSLRAGPGQNWERLAIVPHTTTLRAVGRTITGEWIQVAYEGDLLADVRPEFTRDGVTYGWLWYGLLVWSGDMLKLPIDGVSSVVTARSAGPTFILWPGEYIYKEYVDPSTQVDNPFTTPVTVEVTGRVGSPGGTAMWIQFKMRGEYYWTASWAIGIPGNVGSVPDNSSRYAYGRILRLIRLEYSDTQSIFNDIDGRWQALATGQPTTCNNIPEDARPGNEPITSADLAAEPLYRPMAQGLDEARLSINAALARFRSVCGPLETRAPVSSADIQAAQTDLAQARQALVLVGSLLSPFQRRDPLVGR